MDKAVDLRASKIAPHTLLTILLRFFMPDKSSSDADSYETSLLRSWFLLITYLISAWDPCWKDTKRMWPSVMQEKVTYSLQSHSSQTRH